MQFSRREFLVSVSAICGASLQVLHGEEAHREQPITWLAKIQKPPNELPDDVHKLKPLLVDTDGQTIRTLEAWEKRRSAIKEQWLGFLGPLDVQRAEPKLEVLEEDRPGGVIRQLVRYESEPGQSIQAYLLRPAKISGRAPGIVALHSTTKGETIRQPAGIEGNPTLAFGLHLAERGYVVFCPENFLWQGGKRFEDAVKQFHQRHPKSKGMAKMVFDAQRGLDVLESLDYVDGGRLGAVGHSLGGKEVLYLAALDERVKAAVSSEGGIDISFSNWDAPWYLSDAVKRDDFKLSHHELLALVAPRAFLLIGGDSADGDKSWPFIEAVLPVYDLYGKSRPIGLLNHKQGHSMPPEAERRVYEWFDAYL